MAAAIADGLCLPHQWLSSKVSDEAPEEDTLDKIWAGLDYTIDSETGESIVTPERRWAVGQESNMGLVAHPDSRLLDSSPRHSWLKII